MIYAKQCILLIACLSLLGLNLEGSAFEQGIAAYESGDYSQAIEHFHTSIDTDTETAAARHNLALAYAQSGQTSEALWQLQRAHRLEPSNHELLIKIEALKQQIGLLPESYSWFVLASHYLSFSQWLILSALITWILVWLYLLGRFSQRSLTSGRLTTWILLMLALPFTAVSYLEQSRGQILSEEPVELRAAPASAAPTVGNRLPGSQGRILDQHEGFYKIKTTDQQTGWISKNNFRPFYLDPK